MIFCVGAPGVNTSATPSDLSSSMSWFGIVPPTVTVKRGTTVKWRWTGRDLHNVAVTRGPVKFRSSVKDSGTFSRKMNRTGTYKIHCTIHQPDMRMTLVVR